MRACVRACVHLRGHPISCQSHARIELHEGAEVAEQLISGRVRGHSQFPVITAYCGLCHALFRIVTTADVVKAWISKLTGQSAVALYPP